MKPIKVLIAEDNEDDAFLVISMLEQDGYDVSSKVVCRQVDYISALHEQEWDIIISDYSMPQFNGLEALKFAKGYKPDIPFIIISGTMGEDVAVEAMRNGAHDYMMKGDWTRLLPAIKRELEENSMRREKIRIQKELSVREQERDELLKKLAWKSGMLECKSKQLEEILFVSSHDLKSPLVNISGFLSELKKSCNTIESMVEELNLPDKQKDEIGRILNSEMRNMINVIAENTSKQAAFLEGLVKITAIEKRKLNLDQVDMNATVRDILAKWQVTLKRNDIDVQVDDLAICYTDKDLISTVLISLLENAIKYASPQRKGQIHISCTEESTKSVYCIEDNGIGIAMSHINKIFEIFYQLDPATDDSGHGLGLTLVQRILNKLHGDVWVESTPGQGSRFYFSLPNKAESIGVIDTDSRELTLAYAKFA